MPKCALLHALEEMWQTNPAHTAPSFRQVRGAKKGPVPPQLRNVSRPGTQHTPQGGGFGFSAALMTSAGPRLSVHPSPPKLEDKLADNSGAARAAYAYPINKRIPPAHTQQPRVYKPSERDLPSLSWALRKAHTHHNKQPVSLRHFTKHLSTLPIPPSRKKSHPLRLPAE